MSKDTTYLCIKTLLFKNTSNKGSQAFTKGKTYEGHADLMWSEDGIELTDNAGGLHTVTGGLFDTLFKEQS